MGHYRTYCMKIIQSILELLVESPAVYNYFKTLPGPCLIYANWHDWIEDYVNDYINQNRGYHHSAIGARK